MFTNLYLSSSIDFDGDNKIGTVAQWCYRPSQWIFGRKVVDISGIYYTKAVTRSDPLCDIVNQPWVQLGLRILLLLPTLFGFVLQSFAEWQDYKYKKNFESAKEIFTYDHMLHADLTNPEQKETASEILKGLIPSTDGQQQLAEKSIEILMEEPVTDGIMGAARFLFSVIRDQGAKRYYPDESKFTEPFSYLISDPEHGADNFLHLLFQRGGYDHFNLISGYSQPSEKTTETLIATWLPKLTEDQKIKLAQQLSQKTFSPNLHITTNYISTLITKLNFCGLNKAEEEKKLLFSLENDYVFTSKQEIRDSIYQQLDSDALVQILTDRESFAKKDSWSATFLQKDFANLSAEQKAVVIQRVPLKDVLACTVKYHEDSDAISQRVVESIEQGENVYDMVCQNTAYEQRQAFHWIFNPKVKPLLDRIINDAKPDAPTGVAQLALLSRSVPDDPAIMKTFLLSLTSSQHIAVIASLSHSQINLAMKCLVEPDLQAQISDQDFADICLVLHYEYEDNVISFGTEDKDLEFLKILPPNWVKIYFHQIKIYYAKKMSKNYPELDIENLIRYLDIDNISRLEDHVERIEKPYRSEYNIEPLMQWVEQCGIHFNPPCTTIMQKNTYYETFKQSPSLCMNAMRKYQQRKGEIGAIAAKEWLTPSL